MKAINLQRGNGAAIEGIVENEVTGAEHALGQGIVKESIGALCKAKMDFGLAEEMSRDERERDRVSL